MKLWILVLVSSFNFVYAEVEDDLIIQDLEFFQNYEMLTQEQIPLLDMHKKQSELERIFDETLPIPEQKK